MWTMTNWPRYAKGWLVADAGALARAIETRLIQEVEYGYEEDEKA
jgi:hypothetical protein